MTRFEVSFSVRNDKWEKEIENEEQKKKRKEKALN